MNKSKRRRLAKAQARAERLGDPVERTKRELRINPTFRQRIEQEMAHTVTRAKDE